MEQYKTDSEIYAVLEREIIDLTIRPGLFAERKSALCPLWRTAHPDPGGAAEAAGKRAGKDRALQGHHRYPAEPPHRGRADLRAHRRGSRVLRDFSPRCTPEQRALIRRRVEAYEALAAMESPDYNKLYEADRALHGTWFAAMDKMYLWSTLQNAHADYSRFRMLDTMTTGGLAEVIADHRNLMNAIERCDLAAFEPLVERHLYGGIRRLGSKLTEEYADYFEPEK